jgi:phage terminase small subunit
MAHEMSALKNAKHEHFAQLVASGKSPPKAYVIAGYSENGAQQSANRLLRDAVVAARVEELRRAVEEPARERAIEKAAVSKAWVLSELVDNVMIAKAAVPVLDRNGKATGEYQANIPAANRALELVGKELGMFIDRKEIRTGDLLDETDTETLMEMRRLLEERKPVNATTH